MAENNLKLVGMYAGLVGGILLFFLITNLIGLTNIQITRSFFISLIGVTTAIYVVMVATYHLAEPRTP